MNLYERHGRLWYRVRWLYWSDTHQLGRIRASARHWQRPVHRRARQLRLPW